MSLFQKHSTKKLVIATTSKYVPRFYCMRMKKINQSNVYALKGKSETISSFEVPMKRFAKAICKICDMIIVSNY